MLPIKQNIACNVHQYSFILHQLAIPYCNSLIFLSTYLSVILVIVYLRNKVSLGSCLLTGYNHMNLKVHSGILLITNASYENIPICL